jgi:possible amylase-binding protein abpA
MNKKVLLSVLSAGLLATTVAPLALAQGENPNSSNQLIQKKYVSERDIADEVNRQVAAHDAEIRAEAQKQFEAQGQSAALKAAEAELKAFLDSGYSGHDFTSKKEALEAKVAAAKASSGKSFEEIYNNVKNRYVQVMQQKLRDTLANQYNDPIKDNEPNEKRIADDIEAQTGRKPVVETRKDGSKVYKDDKGNVLATVTKDGKVVKGAMKATKKVLPKTHAAK